MMKPRILQAIIDAQAFCVDRDCEFELAFQRKKGCLDWCAQFSHKSIPAIDTPTECGDDPAICIYAAMNAAERLLKISHRLGRR